MPGKPIEDKDREVIRRGLSVWQAAQLQAGASTTDSVLCDSDNFETIARAPLGDLDAMVDAYIAVLPEMDDDQTTNEWMLSSRAQMVLERGDQVFTAVIALDVSASSMGADFRLERSGLRLRFDNSSYNPEAPPLRWESPLTSAEGAHIGRSKEIIKVAGIVATVLAASGFCRIVHAAPAPFVRVVGMVALSKPLPLWKDDDETCVISEMLNENYTEVSIPLLRLLAQEGGLYFESAERQAQALTSQGPRLLEIAQSLRACHGDWSLCAALGQLESASQGMDFVVPGFIPAGVVTLVAGAAGTGKSTLLHDLAITVATVPDERDPEQHWLGVPVKDIDSGAVVFMSGEDSGAIVAARRQQLQAGPKSGLLFEVYATGKPLIESLAITKRLGPKLLVVDPARAFMSGSEDESGPADGFMAPLVQFATDTGCAVVIVHHLKKGVSPANPAGVLDGIRGSQVFIDRPRAIIGLTERRGILSAAVIKNNIPPTYPMSRETRSFQQNIGTLRLEPISVLPEKAKRALVVVDENVEAVVAAIGQAHAAGQAVTRTGGRGVFELKLPGLEAMTRNAVRAAVDAALGTGRLRALPNKQIVLADAPLPALPRTAFGQSATATADAGM